jgi:predicted transcriptional regulator of viral defense system
MPGAIYNEIYDIAVDQYGYVRSDDLRALDIDVKRLGDLKRRGQATHVGNGLYRLTAIPPTRYDQYMEAGLWHRKPGTISHDTALDLWDVSDINPDRIHITLPRATRLTRTPPALYVIHREDLNDHERTRLEGIPIVTLAKAIRQCAAAHTRPELLRQAIDNGQRKGKLRPAVADALLTELAVERAPA